MNNSQDTSAVTLDTCHKISNTRSPFILMLKKGEPLIDSLIQCAEIVQFPSAALVGIGALENPILGNFDFHLQKHHPKTFPGMYELTNLTGNITRSQNKYMVHVHVTLGDMKDLNCRAITGHLIEASIGIIAEITVIPFIADILREP